MKRRSLVAVFLTLVAVAPARAATIQSPSEFLGMTVGADRTLADYRQILAYFKALDAASPRVERRDPRQDDARRGPVPGRDLVRGEPREQEAPAGDRAQDRRPARPLARPRPRRSSREGKVFLFITCNIHATEIGASQMAMEWAHALATAEDAETKRRLDEVVLLLLPVDQPRRADHGDRVVPQEPRHAATRAGGMPWLYHHYVGHDNNRDWFMLTQKETQAVTRAVYHEWLPQVWLDEHQMGTDRARASSCRRTPSRSTPTSTRWCGATST